MKRLSLSVCATLVLLYATGAAAAASYSHAEVLTVAGELAKSMEIPERQHKEILQRLETSIKKKKWRKRKISGVFAFEMGGGGFVVKITKGEGKLRFKGAGIKGIELESKSIGAQAGGGKEYGVGLVVDLKDASVFGGDYTGGGVEATAGEASVQYKELTYDGDGEAHLLYLVSSGKGFAAGAAGGKLTIRLQ